MANQLAEPEKWTEATLRQAWADYKVASKISEIPIDGEIHGGGVAYDAALDKLQQALEKLLKVIVLAYVPERSDLVFSHRYLSLLDDTSMGVERLKTILDKFFDVTAHMRGANQNLRTIERLIPDPSRADLNKDGKIVGMPENTQYPYTSGGRIVAPCDSFPQKYDETWLADISKDIKLLFQMLSRLDKASERITGIKKLEKEWSH